jgi:hypothetical protein
MTSGEKYRDQASEAREQAERSFRPSDKEAWLRIAEEWMKLAQLRDEPAIGVVGALARIYAIKLAAFDWRSPRLASIPFARNRVALNQQRRLPPIVG